MRQGLKTKVSFRNGFPRGFFEQGGVIEVPETAGPGRRLQRTVVQYLEVSVEVNKNVLWERISEGTCVTKFAVWLSSCGGIG